jgi:glycosyltransferase involved in cell wall biosynthesis
MRILLISLWSISNASIGGTEKFVVDLANLLSKKHLVTILSLGSIDLNIKNVNTHSLNIIKKLDEYSLSKYLENDGFSEIKLKINFFIKENKFDIIHCNSLVFADLIKNIPVIHTVHTNPEELQQSFSLKIIDIILENIKNDKNSTYVTPSFYAKTSFKKLTKKIALVIKHGFSSGIILKNQRSLRHKYGISNKEIVFCVPSRLEIEQKGQETLLKALRSIKELFLPFTVVLGGCDEQYIKNKKYLQKNYSDLKLVINSFSNKNDMYSLSDVIVLPSKTESFGYAALESAMIGVPLFLSDIPPYREIAKDNNYIFLFKNNEIELAKNLQKKSKIILDHKIISPTRKWKNKYSKDTMLKKYMSLYKKCISSF